MMKVIDPAIVGGWLAGGLFAGILAFLALGRWIGKRTTARAGGTPAPSIASMQAAVFALLGLLIAFTFSGALTRFDVRRAQVVEEANAIGTAYLRVDLLPAAAQPRLRDTFREYVDARIATYRKLPDLAAARGELARSQELQNAIWAQAVATLGMPESRPSADVLVMTALNQMFDITTTRVAATRMHPPSVIYAMLIGLALASALLAGYQGAAEPRPDWMHQLGFAFIIAATVYVILDIEHPRLGVVRMDAIDDLLVNVRAGMK